MVAGVQGSGDVPCGDIILLCPREPPISGIEVVLLELFFRLGEESVSIRNRHCGLDGCAACCENDNDDQVIAVVQGKDLP
jgi:hypothetical protein